MKGGDIMTLHYRSRDHLVASKYVVSKDPSSRLALAPVDPIERMLKGVIKSRQFESYDDFTNCIGLIPA